MFIFQLLSRAQVARVRTTPAVATTSAAATTAFVLPNTQGFIVKLVRLVYFINILININ